MKRIQAILFTILVAMGVNAASLSEIEIATKGQTLVGVGVGLPPMTEGADPDMPSISAFFTAGIASGFVRTNYFGNNGAVDFGLNYTICHYSDKLGLYNTYQHVKVFQNTVTLRSAFHFQFVKSLDTYFGLCGGVNICSESYTERTEYSEQSHFEQWDELDHNKFRPVLGIYGGAKWYFSNRIALGIELSNDFMRTYDNACEEAYGRSHFGGSALPIVSICVGVKLGK